MVPLCSVQGSDYCLVPVLFLFDYCVQSTSKVDVAQRKNSLGHIIYVHTNIATHLYVLLQDTYVYINKHISDVMPKYGQTNNDNSIAHHCSKCDYGSPSRLKFSELEKITPSPGQVKSSAKCHRGTHSGSTKFCGTSWMEQGNEFNFFFFFC